MSPKGIAKALGDNGFALVAEPERLLVTKENNLLPGEEAQARAWGARLAQAVRARTAA